MEAFQDGLLFDCTRCGNCCRQKLGALLLSALDLRRIAEYLGLSDEDFFLEYCEVIDWRLAKRVSLIANEDGDCVFWDADGCQVYEYRPLQCRTYPFWATNLADPQSWQQVGKICDGVNRGRHWSPREILDCVESRERDPLLDLGPGE
jgi:uncharacterized protein